MAEFKFDGESMGKILDKLSRIGSGFLVLGGITIVTIMGVSN